MIRTKKSKPVVLGLGNPIFQDEGIGIHVVHQLMRDKLNESIELVDGGTDGLILLDTVEKTDNLLIIDAVNLNQAPGSISIIEGKDITVFAQAKLSQHQLSFQEVLGLALLRGRLPKRLSLIGIQPKTIDIGTNLTPEVAQAVPKVINIVNDTMKKWLA